MKLKVLIIRIGKGISEKSLNFLVKLEVKLRSYSGSSFNHNIM